MRIRRLCNKHIKTYLNRKNNNFKKKKKRNRDNNFFKIIRY